jgi:uncharacterized protein YciI
MLGAGHRQAPFPSPASLRIVANVPKHVAKLNAHSVRDAFLCCGRGYPGNSIHQIVIAHSTRKSYEKIESHDKSNVSKITIVDEKKINSPHCMLISIAPMDACTALAKTNIDQQYP